MGLLRAQEKIGNCLIVKLFKLKRLY
jgi:hypothetical protein